MRVRNTAYVRCKIFSSPFYILTLSHMWTYNWTNWWMRYRFLFLRLSSKRFTAAVVCEQKAGEYLIADLLTRPVFKPFSRSGLSVRDGDPWWLLISYLPVVMYIQFVELQGCSEKVVVTLLLRLLHHASSSLEQTFGGKKSWKYFVPLPLFCFLVRFLIIGRFFLLFEIKKKSLLQ